MSRIKGTLPKAAKAKLDIPELPKGYRFIINRQRVICRRKVWGGLLYDLVGYEYVHNRDRGAEAFNYSLKQLHRTTRSENVLREKQKAFYKDSPEKEEVIKTLSRGVY